MHIGWEDDRERVAVRVSGAIALALAVASPWAYTQWPLHPAAVALLALSLLPFLLANLGVHVPLGGLGAGVTLLPLTVLHLAGGPLGLIDPAEDLQLSFMLVSLVVGLSITTASVPVATAIAVWGTSLPIGRAVVEPAFVWQFWLVGILAGVVIGLVGRRGLQLVCRLEEAQAALARQAALEERHRVAREVHDVVAHSLTVTMLHLGAARLALGPGNGRAAEALSEAERCGRQSLNDIRRTVGLLRADHEPATGPALPHASELGQLVGSWAEAGLPVTLAVEGDLAPLGPTDGLVVYRVVQEALSNVANHAPGATARVHVAVDDRQVTVRVEDDGARTAPRERARTPGLGLQGMRERVELLDGRLEAGPAGRGWLVAATMPLRGSTGRGRGEVAGVSSAEPVE